MVYDLANVRTNVRALVPNITHVQYPDARLTILINNALRRINSITPNRKTASITGDGGKYYSLNAAFADWVSGVSFISKIAAPAPVVADDDPVEYLQPGIDYNTYNDGTVDQLYLTGGLLSTENALIDYSTPWTVTGADGAVATTIPIRFQDALEFLTASLMCYALSAQAAGTQSSSIPGDLINYHNSEREYRDAGQNWEKQYEKVLGIGMGGNGVAAVMKRASYNTGLQNGSPRMTHR